MINPLPKAQQAVHEYVHRTPNKLSSQWNISRAKDNYHCWQKESFLEVSKKSDVANNYPQ